MFNPIQFTLSGSADTSRDPSPAIWGDCPVLEILLGEKKGIYFYDNFQDLPLAPTLTTQIAFGKYKAYAAAGCTIQRVSAINSVELQGGCLQIALDTDNDEAAIAQAYPSYLLSGLTTNSGKLWFECCYAQNSVATNMAATFIGLGEVDAFTLAANVPMNSGDAIDNSGAMIGFRIEEDGLGVVDTVYSDRATSFTNIGDTEGGTLVAHTFKKLGFIYDPQLTGTDSGRPENCCVRFFQDNQLCATGLTKSTLTGLTNLDANALGLLWATAADSGGTSFLGSLKWWRVAQLFTPVG